MLSPSTILPILYLSHNLPSSIESRNELLLSILFQFSKIQLGMIDDRVFDYDENYDEMVVDDEMIGDGGG